MNYQRSLKVAKRYQSLTFTDVELPTFTKGRAKRNIIALTFTEGEQPTFTDGELPTFTEGSKKITITNVH